MPETDSVQAGYGTLLALGLLIAASVWLGTAAQRVVDRGSFVKGYFLGNRGLGSWALALTTTVQSGGTFMGFPSLVYTHGWVMALWIAGYMMVPLASFAVVGKRVAHLSRRTGAITVPDLLRERFGSPAVGLTALGFILLFMSFMMVAQFKAGALIMKVSWPGANALALTEEADGGLDRFYYWGLAIFGLTVVGYTLIGGFLAAVWTDLFQSVMMFLGVMLLACLVIPAAGGLEQATQANVARWGPDFAYPPGLAPPGRVFLPPGLMVSVFFIWVCSGVGSPAGVVRIMACRDTSTIRRSLALLGSYNLFIYWPLIFICICGRALIPNLPASHADEIIPRLALASTSSLPGGSFWAGLILAAPFGAVMATVSSYLVVIASGLVRDLYQRFLCPDASQRAIRRLTYGTMLAVGAVAFAANLWPVNFLQAIVVFSGSCAACTFVVPMIWACYWRRATASGAIAAMVAGAGVCFGLYALGWILAALAARGQSISWLEYDPLLGPDTRFRPYYLLGLDPLLWGIASSALVGTLWCWASRPPEERLISRLFDRVPTEPATAN